MGRIQFEKTALSGGRPNRQSSRAMHLDLLIGFLGFFTFLTFAFTLYAEVTGEDATTEALILLALVLILWGLFRLRRRLN